MGNRRRGWSRRDAAIGRVLNAVPRGMGRGSWRLTARADIMCNIPRMIMVDSSV